uniref:Uncharacterized protein n=1 Tax=viral metagenome TaxID=1070528 RepID=A0A6M3J1W8_9ZZZZ
MMQLQVAGDFAAQHFWPNAPVKYVELGKRHRHVFTFRALIEVSESGDREVEFLELADMCTAHLKNFLRDNPGSSCETLVRELHAFMARLGRPPTRCEVLEDDRCGAVYAPEKGGCACCAE